MLPAGGGSLLSNHAVLLSFGAGFEAMLFDGVLAAAGLAMIIPMFVPSRWRRRAAAPLGYAPDYGTAPSGDTGLLSSDWAETAPQPQVGEDNDFRYH
jgi:hypothetical protein